jgi:3-hydroxyacyl-CoA dehydrogenase/enoyl-CoA hydratase/3-hydroxybutyryl-CoA epimerase
MILTGEPILPAEAKRIGLIDQVLPADRADVGLQALIDRVRDRRPLRTRSPLARIGRGIRSLAVAAVRPRVPIPVTGTRSPFIEARVSVAAGLLSEGEGLATERAALSRLGATEETRTLLALHRHAAAPVRAFPEPVNPIPPVPRRVGIVGGGELGSTLACRLAGLGVEVVVQERDATAADQAGRRVADRLVTLARRNVIGHLDARRIGAAIRPTTEWISFDGADLVIEAADEDAGVKRNLFHYLERRVRPRVILATASTTVTVDAIQAESARPGRIAGFHVPNPDGRQPVAELVGAALTDPGTLVALDRWARDWGFTPVRIADRPGRLVDHVRLTYLSEGVHLVAEGLPIDGIDAGCRRFGMFRGPLEWCDEIGLDRLSERAAQMQLARGDGFARNLLFQRLVPFGCVGQAYGEGFYRYGWRRRPSQVARMALWNDLDEDAIAPYVFDAREAMREGIERIVMRTVNAAAAALAEEPDSDPKTVDLALAFGMGWAPARGGPLRYADGLGLAAVADRLSLFAERFGPRFRPCDELVRRAEAGETFHGGLPPEAAAPIQRWRLAG